MSVRSTGMFIWYMLYSSRCNPWTNPDVYEADCIESNLL